MNWPLDAALVAMGLIGFRLGVRYGWDRGVEHAEREIPVLLERRSPS